MNLCVAMYLRFSLFNKYFVLFYFFFFFLYITKLLGNAEKKIKMISDMKP